MGMDGAALGVEGDSPVSDLRELISERKGRPPGTGGLGASEDSEASEDSVFLSGALVGMGGGGGGAGGTVVFGVDSF